MGVLINAKVLDVVESERCNQDGFLIQYADNPTREGTTLDLVFGNVPSKVSRVQVGEHCGNIIVTHNFSDRYG